MEQNIFVDLDTMAELAAEEARVRLRHRKGELT